MLLNTFGDRVRYLRRLWGLTQPEVHKAGGPARTTLFRIESGEALPEHLTESTLKGLALALKCHRQWLETGVGGVWPEGVVPPEEGKEVLRQNFVPGASMPEIDPVLGRYITEGPIDWAIVARAVQIVKGASFAATLTGKMIPLNEAEAYRLVYIHLTNQENPFQVVPSSSLNLVLSLATKV